MLQLTRHDNMPHVPTLQSIHTLSVVTFVTASATKSSTLRLMLLNLQWNDFTMQPGHHQVCSMLRPVGWVEFQKEILWLSHWGSERLPNHLCHGDKLDLKNHWHFPSDELWCLFVIVHWIWNMCIYHHTSIFYPENQRPCSVCEYPYTSQLKHHSPCLSALWKQTPQSGQHSQIFKVPRKWHRITEIQKVKEESVHHLSVYPVWKNAPLPLALVQANDRTLATLLTHGRPWSWDHGDTAQCGLTDVNCCATN